MPETRRYLNAAGVLLVGLVLIPFVIFAFPQVAGASHAYIVLSDSMSPHINAGDVVVVDDVPTSRIDEGDVITFRRPGAEAEKVTHRVVKVVQRDGERHFRTKGDANEEPDPELVPRSNVVGLVRFHIPLIGHVISFGSTTTGTVTLVIVPAILLIVNEVVTLYRAAAAGQTDPEGRSDSTSLDSQTWEWAETDAQNPDELSGKG